MVLVPILQALQAIVTDAAEVFWAFTQQCSPVLRTALTHSTMLIEFGSSNLFNSNSAVVELLGKYLGTGLVVNPATQTFGYGNVTPQINSQRGSEFDWHGTEHSSISSVRNGGTRLDLTTVGNTSDSYYKSYLRGYTNHGPINYVTVTHSVFEPFNDYACVVVAMIAALTTRGRATAINSYMDRQLSKNNAFATREAARILREQRAEAQRVAAAQLREDNRLRRAGVEGEVEEPEVQGP